MGLRETKAQRTRASIVDTATDLILDQGYDATTMEQIAERAEVGTSTLYRYFASKDLIVLDVFARSLDAGGMLRRRPTDEPIEASLREVIIEAIGLPMRLDSRFRDLRTVVDNAPVPRARLWDLVEHARADLELALAERLDRPADDLLVQLSARLVFELYELAGERWWNGTGRVETVVDDILDELSGLALIVPRSSRSNSSV